MNTNRRNFLKKAAITAPGVAFIGTTQGMPGTSYFNDQNQLNINDDRQLDDGWLNVRDYGVSGSKFETTAATTSGSKQITVADTGDFKVGQGVMVSKCNIRYTPTRLWSTGISYITTGRPLENSVEVRGHDGSSGSWVVYVLDIAPSANPVFRWTDAVGRTGKSQYQGNIFENCFDGVTEKNPGLWKNSMIKDNRTIECVRKMPK